MTLFSLAILFELPFVPHLHLQLYHFATSTSSLVYSNKSSPLSLQSKSWRYPLRHDLFTKKNNHVEICDTSPNERSSVIPPAILTRNKDNLQTTNPQSNPKHFTQIVPTHNHNMLTNPPPPRGPRGSSPQVRGRGRGGIQKRRTGGPAPRVDRDGDLNMDAAASTTDKPRSGNGRGKPTSDRPGRSQAGPAPRSGGRGSHISDRAKQNIVRGLGGKQANVLESRITDGGLRLQVSGLSESKAAGNPDGGLDALLSFLERKASGLDSKSNRAVKIKKVCSLS